MQSDANEAMLAAERIERISQLESEVETRRAEINRLQEIHAMKGQATNDAEKSKGKSNDPAIQSESLRNSLRDLIVLWEQRLSDNRSAIKKISTTAQPNKDNPATAADGNARHSTDVDAPPAMVWESDDEVSAASTDATPNSPSPRWTSGLIENLLHPFGSHGREMESFAESEVLERMIEERDLKIDSLEAVISSDTGIIGKMKDTIERLVREREDAELISSRKDAELKEALPTMTIERGHSSPGDVHPSDTLIGAADSRSALSTLEMIVGELESTISLQEKHNKTLKAESVRLKVTITDLESRRSSQENIIEFLKAKLVTLLVSKRMVEEELNTDIERRDITISNLKSSCEKKADRSQRIIAALEAHSSSLEDQIEDLKAANVRLRVRSQILEEEKRMVEEEMKTEMQLLYIETGRHEIL